MDRRRKRRTPSSLSRNSIKFPPGIIKNFPFLKSLSARRKSPTACSALISTATTTQLLALVEIALNILKKRVHLSRKDRKTLSSQAQVIRQLSKSKSPREARRQLLVPAAAAGHHHQQKGAGLPVVAAGLLASVIVPIITEFINKATRTTNT